MTGMSNALPSRVIADVRFIGRAEGAVRALAGFKKGRHTLPDAVNATTNAFLGRLCAGELGTEAEALFQQVRTTLGYKRKDLALTLNGPLAVLSARDFSFEILYALEEDDPTRYAVTQTLLDLKDGDLALAEAFNAIFTGMFTELSFALRQRVRVEAVIDAVENLEDERGMTVDYPSDCRDCIIRVPEVSAQVRCTGSSIDLVFAQAGAPRELLAEFAAVRAAFQLSKVLAGLVA